MYKKGIFAREMNVGREIKKQYIYTLCTYIYTVRCSRTGQTPPPSSIFTLKHTCRSSGLYTFFFNLNHPFMTYFWSDLYHHCEKLPITNILWKAYSTYKYVQMGLIFDKMFACKFINCLFQNFHTYAYSSKIQLF